MKQRRSEEKYRRERENEQFRWRREVLFIGNGGAYRRFQNAYMRSYAYRRFQNAYMRYKCIEEFLETPIGVIQNAYMRSNAYRRL